MKQVLGEPHRVRDDLQSHLEYGVMEGQENRIRERHRAKEKLEDLKNAGDWVGPR